jgi:hypothetical protein
MKLSVGDKVMVRDVIDLNTSLPFTVTKTTPYGESSGEFYEVTNGKETANIHISRLVPVKEANHL